jgi:hypothetical protein
MSSTWGSTPDWLTDWLSQCDFDFDFDFEMRAEFCTAGCEDKS